MRGPYGHISLDSCSNSTKLMKYKIYSSINVKEGNDATLKTFNNNVKSNTIVLDYFKKIHYGKIQHVLLFKKKNKVDIEHIIKIVIPFIFTSHWISKRCFYYENVRVIYLSA